MCGSESDCLRGLTEDLGLNEDQTEKFLSDMENASSDAEHDAIIMNAVKTFTTCKTCFYCRPSQPGSDVFQCRVAPPIPGLTPGWPRVYPASDWCGAHQSDADILAEANDGALVIEPDSGWISGEHAVSILSMVKRKAIKKAEEKLAGTTGTVESVTTGDRTFYRVVNEYQPRA